MASLSSWLRRPSAKAQAERLYHGAVRQARTPDFYRIGGVADTVDGRFDLICLHVHLLLQRLAAEPDPAARGLAQTLYDVMFADFDRCLREMGVSDVTVGKRVQEMTELFHGRLVAYRAGFQEGRGALADAVRRNLFRGDPDAEAQADGIAAYALRAAAALAAAPFAALKSGVAPFPSYLEGGEPS